MGWKSLPENVGSEVKAEVFIDYIPTEEVLEELVRDVPIMFGSRFFRAWLQENKHWMNTDIVRAIERGLKNAPVGSDLEYYRRIDALAATL